VGIVYPVFITMRRVYKMVTRAMVFLVLAALAAGGIPAQADHGTIRLSQAKNSSYNYTGVLQRYKNIESAGHHGFDILESDYRDIRSGKSVSMAGYHENDLKKYQANMRSLREEAARNGYTIPQSSWETFLAKKVALTCIAAWFGVKNVPERPV
jgi:hypothetical protein